MKRMSTMFLALNKFKTTNTIVSDSTRAFQLKTINYNKFRFGYLVQLQKTYLDNLKFFNNDKQLLIEDMRKWKIRKNAAQNNLDLTNIPTHITKGLPLNKIRSIRECETSLFKRRYIYIK